MAPTVFRMADLWPFVLVCVMADKGFLLHFIIIRASLSKPHTKQVAPSKLVLSTMHKKLRQKSGNLCVRREFNSIDYSASLCSRPCHDK